MASHRYTGLFQSWAQFLSQKVSCGDCFHRYCRNTQMLFHQVFPKFLQEKNSNKACSGRFPSSLVRLAYNSKSCGAHPLLCFLAMWQKNEKVQIHTTSDCSGMFQNVPIGICIWNERKIQRKEGIFDLQVQVLLHKRQTKTKAMILNFTDLITNQANYDAVTTQFL